MEIYYRYRYRPEGERIYRKTSSDGISWSDRELVMEVKSTRGDELLSPSLIYEDGIYKMWWVGPKGVIYMSTSKTGLAGTWSAKKRVNLNFVAKNLRPWHLEVFKDNGKHYLLLNSYNGMEVEKGRILAIGESGDGGLSFKNVQTILKPNINSWDNRDIYRGSIIKVDGIYKLYYSARNLDRSWGIGLAESESLRYWKGIN